MALIVACGGEPPRLPNVVLVSADTLRPDRLNAYGYLARTTSPHVDALARDGIVFETAIAASPWTMPSHMSLFTGLSPSSHGIVTPLSALRAQQDRNEVQRLPESRTTLAEVLASHGYRTAAFTGGGPMDPRIGFDQGFSVYRTSMFKMSDASMGDMLAWVREDSRQPFFLFWHTFETHFPYLDPTFLSVVLPEPAVREARTVLERIWRDVVVKGVAAAAADTIAPVLRVLGLLNRNGCEALYAGSVHSLDRWLGVLLDALRTDGLYDQTLIIFTSDHGEEFGDHHPTIFFNGHGHTMFEELVRIPLVVKLPSREHAGLRVQGTVRHIDIYPTVLDVLGLPLGETVEGESARPLWEDPNAPSRTALIEATAFAYELKAVRNARRKYIVAIDETDVAARGRQYVPNDPVSRTLYDLKRDPAETVDLLFPPSPAGAAGEAAVLDQTLRALVPRVLGATDRAALDAETVERLRALGYVK